MSDSSPRLQVEVSLSIVRSPHSLLVSTGQVPRIIFIVPLVPSLSPRRFLANLLPSLGLSDTELEDIISSLNERGQYLVRAPRFKTSLQINLLPPISVYPTLDAALVSDYVVLLLSSTDEVQFEGEAVLRCLQGQAGGVEVVSCVQVGSLVAHLAKLMILP